jgi:predicted LPLAT superfamily acyltransferase
MSTKQRGSGWSIRLVYCLYRAFGYTFIYYLMYPVSFFYFLVAHNVKAALKDYYARIGVPFNNRVYFTHLRHFAITMCDRFISKVRPNDYRFEIEKEEELLVTMRQGCILLLSHFGGWAAAGNCFHDATIHIVMQEALLEEIKRIEEDLPSVQSNIHVIDLAKGGVAVSLEIASALLKNEIVAMMGDRAREAKHHHPVLFFGHEADLNQNPFLLAYKTQKPIVALAVIYQKPQCYKIKYLKIIMQKKNPQSEEIHKAMQAYADFLASVVACHPEQWFNFYHFWKEDLCA